MRSTADAAFIMMVPGAWRRSTSSFFYESLASDGEGEEEEDLTHRIRRRRRPQRKRGVAYRLPSIAQRDTRKRGVSLTRPHGVPTSSSSTSCADTTTHSHSLSVTNDSWNHRDELDLFALRRSTTVENIQKPHFRGSTVFWPSYDSYSSSSDDDETMIYATKYCDRTTNRLDHRRRIVDLPQHRKVLNSSSCSFDTLETQTEEETSTFSSYDETKTVRWPDYANAGNLETRHSYDADETHTCRIVILLLLNNGKECPPDENFEFLHCEYIVPDKLKVSDVLSQISFLVNASNRPFTAMFHRGREMINALAIQDFDLQDGQSMLIATRSGEQALSIILKQANILLRDKMLLAELRKARIAGRSLQLLHSSSRSMDKNKSKQNAIPSNPSLELSSVGSFRDVSSEVCEM